jgi:drug/metabolite transporter (DMT)-like permease
MWGLWWIPLRLLQQAGLVGHWTTFAIYGAAVLALLPLAYRHRRSWLAHGWALIAIGVLFGLVMVFWNYALLVGDVVRVTLLFYLAPVWATGLVWLWFGRRPGLLRFWAIAAALVGASVVLGFEGGFPMPRSEGDWMGLAAGMTFALAAASTRRLGERPGLGTSFMIFVMASLLALPAALLWRASGAAEAPLTIDAAMEVGHALIVLALLVAAVALVWLLPQTWLMLWGAARLDPGLVSILFLVEVVVAAFSAALLTDETFGLREFAGCGLIIAAGLLEARAEVKGHEVIP